MIFSSANIPAGIDSFEKLALWAGLVLQQGCGTRECVEIEGARPERVAQCPQFIDANNVLRVSVRLSIPVSRDVYSDKTKKYWCFADPLVDATVPVAYTTP